MSDTELHRLSAFADGAGGGNPAGVWLGEALPDADSMRRIAAEVGYSETAFVVPRQGAERTVRYYSPEAEVSFCGHATIATGVLLGRMSGEGRYVLSTAAGEVPVDVRQRDGRFEAAFRSVAPRHRIADRQAADRKLVDDTLRLLGWDPAELDESIPPAIAYAGAWHLVLAAADAGRLATLDYDFDRVKKLMRAAELTTLQLVWRAGPDRFHARDPFPVGGVVEDPATGAAAAALGGYLRDAGLIDAPATFTIRQGEAMGRPSLLTVDVPAEGGIVVSGAAIDIH